MPTTPTILYSTTRGWNPGDEFILFGVRALVEDVLGAHNPIIYNHNPELHATRVLFPRLAEAYDFTLVCHFADEAHELSDWLPGVGVRYSYDARDYAEIYDKFDLTITTRVPRAMTP